MKRNLLAICLLCVSLVSLGANPGQKGKLPKSAKNAIDRLVNKGIEDDLYPGAVVLVAQNGQILYEKAYGYSEVTPKKVKMTTNTLFDIASLSKCTGTLPCVMQLIEQGKVDINAPVKKYIPEFEPWTDGTEKVDITVRQLLSHTSGIDAYIAQDVAKKLRTEWGEYSNEKTVEYIAKKAKRNFRPGTGYIYSCLNFITLQGIVERVSGKRLCDYAKENIWQPLGMNNTHYFVEEKPVPEDLEIASTEVVDGVTLHGRVHDPVARLLNGGNSGNAGVFTTAEDMAKYAFAILEGGKGVLKPETVNLMTREQNDVEKENGRTLGWQQNASYCGKFKKDYCICHTGYTGTSMVIDLDNGLVVIFLTNRVHPKDWNDDAHSLRNVRIGITEPL